MKRKIVLLIVFVIMIVAIPCTIFAAETQETADVKISASRFTVTGKSVTQKNYYYQTRPIGNAITVTYKGTDNFRFWIDENGMAVSTEPVYSFTLLHPISLTAVTTARTGDQTSARVVFLSDYGQVISSRIYNDSEAIVFPEPLYRSGKRFIGWSFTEDDIVSEMLSGEEYIAVTPVFESIDQHSIEVYYKTNDNRELQTSTIIGSGESFVATAPESFNGQPFAYWLPFRYSSCGLYGRRRNSR
ncbi:MAG: hypothetical protein MJ137_09340 [Clostridia bacterium]|nr:hypothetical protein [Clostridia bacterium]